MAEKCDRPLLADGAANGLQDDISVLDDDDYSFWEDGSSQSSCENSTTLAKERTAPHGDNVVAFAGDCAIDMPEAEEVSAEVLPQPSGRSPISESDAREQHGIKVKEERIRAMKDAGYEIYNDEGGWDDDQADLDAAYAQQYSRCIRHYTLRSFAILTLALTNGVLYFLSSSFSLIRKPSENPAPAINGTPLVITESVVADGWILRSLSLLSLFAAIFNAILSLIIFHPEASQLRGLFFAQLVLAFFGWWGWMLGPEEAVGESWGHDQWLSSLLMTFSILDGVLLATIIFAMFIRGGKRALVRQTTSLRETVRTKPLAVGIAVAHQGFIWAGLYLYFFR